jgi:hypothetical protein
MHHAITTLYTGVLDGCHAVGLLDCWDTTGILTAMVFCVLSRDGL